MSNGAIHDFCIYLWLIFYLGTEAELVAGTQLDVLNLSQNFVMQYGIYYWDLFTGMSIIFIIIIASGF